jgi:hypothetical protein
VINKGNAGAQNNLFTKPKANFSPVARTYLAALGIENLDTDQEAASLLWMHTLAIGFSPAYLTENADGIQQDWPRIPLPDTAEQLVSSAHLGQTIADLLDTEKTVPGVTVGTIYPEIRTVAVVSRAGGGSLNPNAGELALTAGWGHEGRDGAIMPGKGRVISRDYSAQELAAIEQSAWKLNLPMENSLECLGKTTFDIYLNDVAYWRNIPEKVWNYYIGGYQVVKKWLSYRERDLLSRSLTMDEIDEVTYMARRLAAICLLQPALDSNYQAIKQTCWLGPQE